MRISSIEGNRQRLDGGSMFGNVPRPVWEKWIVPDEHGRIELACRAVLVEIDDSKILLETGIGGFFESRLAVRFGVETPGRHVLLENLNRRGVAPGEIDYVVLSHLHFDHAGGLLSLYQDDGAKSLVFPNAKFLVGQAAWQRATHPHPRDRASFIPHLPGLLKDSGRLILVGQDPLPELFREQFEFIYSHGHTPGQMHTLVKGPREQMFFSGDLVPGRPWTHLPITMGYDRFPELIIDEKVELYPRALAEKWWMFFCHDPQIAGARLNLTDGRYGCREERTSFDRFEL